VRSCVHTAISPSHDVRPSSEVHVRQRRQSSHLTSNEAGDERHRTDRTRAESKRIRMVLCANRGERRDDFRTRFPSFPSLLYTVLPSAIGIRMERLYALTFSQHLLVRTHACPRENSRRDARREPQDEQVGVAELGKAEPRTSLLWQRTWRWLELDF
jgi:hypothetical protein